MFKFTFIKNDAKNVLLLTIYFFKVYSLSAPLRDAAIVYVNVNIRGSKVIIMTFYLRIALL